MIIAGIFGMMGALSAPIDHDDVSGAWYTPKKDTIVEIADCGDGTPCGTVAWIDPTTAEFTHDVHNRNASLRGRPMVGVELIGGFEPAAEGWDGGDIYNPRDGKTYRAEIRRISDTELQVKGCWAVVCVTQEWTAAGASRTD